MVDTGNSVHDTLAILAQSPYTPFNLPRHNFRHARHRLVSGKIQLMARARNPFTYDRDLSVPQDTEFGFGRGHFPDPRIDFSAGGSKSRIPIADPDRHTQLMQLFAQRRLDINDPNDQPSSYVEGNTDRYGAQPPLVREKHAPAYKPPPVIWPRRMERHW